MGAKLALFIRQVIEVVCGLKLALDMNKPE
jgi:hypothetical protein